LKQAKGQWVRINNKLTKKQSDKELGRRQLAFISSAFCLFPFALFILTAYAYFNKLKKLSCTAENLKYP